MEGSTENSQELIYMEAALTASFSVPIQSVNGRPDASWHAWCSASTQNIQVHSGDSSWVNMGIMQNLASGIASANFVHAINSPITL